MCALTMNILSRKSSAQIGQQKQGYNWSFFFTLSQALNASELRLNVGRASNEFRFMVIVAISHFKECLARLHLNFISILLKEASISSSSTIDHLWSLIYISDVSPHFAGRRSVRLAVCALLESTWEQCCIRRFIDFYSALFCRLHEYQAWVSSLSIKQFQAEDKLMKCCIICASPISFIDLLSIPRPCYRHGRLTLCESHTSNCIQTLYYKVLKCV